MKLGSKMSYRRQSITSEVIDGRSDAIERFAIKNGHMPRGGKRANAEERKLRSWYDNIIQGKAGNPSPEQAERLRILNEAYRSKQPVVDINEELRYFVAYAKQHGETPHQSSDDPRVRRCAFAVTQKLRMEDADEGLVKQYEECRRDYGVLTYETVDEFIGEFMRFVHDRHRAPDQHSSDLHERRLAKNYRERRDAMTVDQKKLVYGCLEEVRPRGKTSYSEKLLTCALKHAMPEGAFVGCNLRVGGREADVLVLNADRVLTCIQYDGAVHRGGRSDLRDHSADTLMVEMGLRVVRVREPGSNPYLPSTGISVVELEKPLLELGQNAFFSEVREVVRAANLTARVDESSWDAIREQAAVWSSTASANAEGVAEYIYRCIVEGCSKPSGDMDRLKARLRRRIETKLLDAFCVRALALIEKGLDQTTQWSRMFSRLYDKCTPEVSATEEYGEGLPEVSLKRPLCSPPDYSIAESSANAIASWFYWATLGVGADYGAPSLKEYLVGNGLINEIPVQMLTALLYIAADLDRHACHEVGDC